MLNTRVVVRPAAAYRAPIPAHAKAIDDPGGAPLRDAPGDQEGPSAGTRYGLRPEAAPR